NLTGTGFVFFILGLTAIFNAMHAVFSIVVSLVLVNAILTRAPQLVAGREWIRRTLTFPGASKSPSVLPNDRGGSDSGTAGNGSFRELEIERRRSSLASGNSPEFSPTATCNFIAI